MKASVKLKLILFVTAIVLTCSVTLGIYGIIKIIGQAKEELVSKQRLLVESFAQNVDEYIAESKRIVTVTSQSRAIKDVSEFGNISEEYRGLSDDQAVTQRAYLKNILKTYDNFAYLETFTPDKAQNVVLEPYAAQLQISKEAYNRGFSTRNWYKGATSNRGIYLSDAYVSASVGKAVFAISIPIFDDANKISGIYIGAIKLDRLSDMISDLDYGETGISYIIDTRGNILAHPDKSYISGSKLTNIKEYKIVDSILNGASVEMEAQWDELTKSDVYMDYKAIPDTEWIIVTQQNVSEIFKGARAIRSNMIIATILIIVLVVLVTILIANRAVAPIIALGECFQKAAAGDLSVRSQVKSRDEIGIMAGHFNTFMDKLRVVMNDVVDLTETGRKGQLEHRGDVHGLSGEFKQLVEGINAMLDAILLPIAEENRVLRLIRGGNLREKVEIECEGDHEIMKDAVNGMHAWLSELVNYVTRISQGDMNADMAKASDGDQIHEYLIAMRENIKALVDDANRLAESGAEGRLADRADEMKHEGAYRDVIGGVNRMLDVITGHFGTTGEMLALIAHGEDVALITEEVKGDYEKNKQNVNTCVTVLNDIRKDIQRLVQAGLDGELDVRVDASQYEGDWNAIAQGLNGIMEAMVLPLNETAEVLNLAACNDLTGQVAGQYNGQFATLKENVNQMIRTLNAALIQVAASISQVNSGAEQISEASQSLSQGATEQASALEEITSSLMEIASQTKTNAENATQATLLANSARDAAESGGKQMAEMVDAMNDINTSSQQIAKIIKVIDDIAFQTNLLALNAAVEAARAGVHGKGFAVVADEVRNLAGRSAKAAKETADLIDLSESKVSKGQQVAESTAESFQGIISGIVKAADLVGEIAAASNEQAQGIAQISIGLSQVDQVTQQNTANAEETAAAAEELSGQSRLLNEQIAKFKLSSSQKEKRLPAAQKPREIPTRKPQLPRSSSNDGWGAEPKKSSPAADDVIQLDDVEFGRF